MRKLIYLALAAAALSVPASAAGSPSVQIRHVDLARLPLVHVTAVVPAGSRPELTEDGQAASFVKARELGSAEAMVLAVDNSESMRGSPLREAKRAAGSFLAQQVRTGSTGLVVFGHEALPLTRTGESSSEVAATLVSLAPDAETGTALYDAVETSVTRLRRMSSGTRILVLLTDGRDLGSHTNLSQAITAAQRANVIVYPIAAGPRVDQEPLIALAHATGGRLFDTADVTGLSAAYQALRRELDRTWQISYLARTRPGDRTTITVRAAGGESTVGLPVPERGGKSLLDSIPVSIAQSAVTGGVIVLLTALLLVAAWLVASRRRRASAISRLLEPHIARSDHGEEKADGSGRLDPLLEWTARALEDMPGSARLARALERSGLKLRLAHVPYLAGTTSIVLGVVVTLIGAGPVLAVICILAGLALPLVVFRIAAGRRRKAFDRQLPDVLATIASTLRAGHGLRPAMRAVADDGSPPTSEEFTRVLGEERLGRPLDQAIGAMCERIDSPDLEYVATAIKVHTQTGGSLATLFDTLGETVRERQRHARKVRALTSMGRMSATVLICLPFGLTFLMTLISPSYMKPLYTTSTGHFLIGLCLTSMAVGGLLLKRIVNVRY